MACTKYDVDNDGDDDNYEVKGRPPTKKNYYFRALPESGGGRPLPESFGPLFTKY